LALLSNAQNSFTCPWNEVNCRGKCGRFTDANGDGFCDYGKVIPIHDKEKETKDSISKTSPSLEKNKPPKKLSLAVSQDTLKPNKKIKVKTFVLQSCLRHAPEAKVVLKKRHYNFFSIAGSTFFLYLFTSILASKKIIKKRQHFKFWNWMLLLTFLVTGILGFILVFQINYNWKIEWIRDFLYFHVQFGIAMGSISFYHIWWHRKYFLKILGKSKNE
jgi:hypothetical protein